MRVAPRSLTLFAIVCSLAAACATERPRATSPSYEVKTDRVTLHKAGPLRFETTPATRGRPPSLPDVPARVMVVDALTSPSFAPLAGRVVETRARLGDRVKTGDKLVLVRTSDLAGIEHEVRASELEMQTRAATLGRLKELVALRAGSTHELTLAESELNQARLRLETARARMRSLQVARADATSYWVTATRDGTVVQLEAKGGAQVGPESGAPLATVSDLREVVVVGDVPQQDAAALRVGEAARVALSPSQRDAAYGQIESIADIVDPDRQTVAVRVRVRNDERRLRPNAYVELAFSQSPAREAVIVPCAAVVRDGAKAVVFVEQSGTYVKRIVEIGQQDKESVEVLSGLSVGERVVKSNALLLLNAIDLSA